jgi:hypothetical protein
MAGGAFVARGSLWSASFHRWRRTARSSKSLLAASPFANEAAVERLLELKVENTDALLLNFSQFANSEFRVAAKMQIQS